jgi:site-specific DNA recombinase
MTSPRIRCALYTRKSSEEGLDQQFNSLDAQREACAAYVKSQAGEGWRAHPDEYGDGGFSGGTMERPALKRLLDDIAAGKLDVVVVYKIDRLTRSLADFARMVELFDRHKVSFVSVTQAFNTTSSMGRLTLNVLLSFAQFEREITGERIRDKIAASKAKGMWMGGVPPLGYDIPIDKTRALVVNPDEAETVRTIFTTYRELASVHAVQRWLEQQGICSKARTGRSGRVSGGVPFSRGALFHLLRNKIYLGVITHKGASYPGAHPAIIDPTLFDAVQDLLNANARRHEARSNHVVRAPLAGRIFDTDGQPMSPTFSHGARGQVYRYYVSAPLQQGHPRSAGDRAVRRVSATAIETNVTALLQRLLPASGDTPLANLLRVEIHATSLDLLVPVALLPRLRGQLRDGETAERDQTLGAAVRVRTPTRLQLRGGRTIIEGAVPQTARRDTALIKALRAAHRMMDCDDNGLPILHTAPVSPYERRLIRLAFLAPELQAAILAGRQPAGLTLAQLMRMPIPALWRAQMVAVEAPC